MACQRSILMSITFSGFMACEHKRTMRAIQCPLGSRVEMKMRMRMTAPS